MSSPIDSALDTNTAKREDRLALLYHENSKLNPVNDLAFAEQIAAVSQNEPTVRDYAQPARQFPGHQRIALKSDFRDRGDSLFQIIRSRRTRRNFAARPLTSETLSRLLWFAASETGSMPAPTHPEIMYPLRAAPSAGALHCIEIYPVLFASDDWPVGVYHYHAPSHSMELLQPECQRETVAPHLLAPELTGHAAGVIVLTAVLERVMAKYGERGYRFALLDAGHLAQNILLVCEEIGLAAVPLGGFHDDALGNILGLDPSSEIALYPILVGPRTDHK